MGTPTRPSQARHEAEKTQGSSAAGGGESKVNGLGAGLRVIVMARDDDGSMARSEECYATLRSPSGGSMRSGCVGRSYIRVA
jgi:hypothetical protein